VRVPADGRRAPLLGRGVITVQKACRRTDSYDGKAGLEEAVQLGRCEARRRLDDVRQGRQGQQEDKYKGERGEDAVNEPEQALAAQAKRNRCTRRQCVGNGT
jgi:hypothetical protein